MRNLCFALVSIVIAAGAALAQTSPVTSATVPAGRGAHIMMIRMPVSDLERADKFYHAVFGTTVVQKMGEKIRMIMFPGGMPGIILIQSAGPIAIHNSFVVQVPDLKEALERAAANGGTLQNTHFAQQEAGMPAQSSHFTDPEGNTIEVLQMGGPSK
jgi:predicted enzyme related to lactoylglutathione lyase